MGFATEWINEAEMFARSAGRRGTTGVPSTTGYYVESGTAKNPLPDEFPSGEFALQSALVGPFVSEKLRSTDPVVVAGSTENSPIHRYVQIFGRYPGTSPKTGPGGTDPAYKEAVKKITMDVNADLASKEAYDPKPLILATTLGLGALVAIALLSRRIK